jgi:hypothetical protein
VFLVFGLLSSLVTLASFAAILWRLSGSITVPIGGFEITIPGYMFWVAVLYSGVGSALGHLVGHPLIRLNNRQRRSGSPPSGACARRPRASRSMKSKNEARARRFGTPLRQPTFIMANASTCQVVFWQICSLPVLVARRATSWARSSSAS